MTEKIKSLMDYCDNLTDYLDIVTDDLYRVLIDNDLPDDVFMLIGCAHGDLVKAWKKLKGGKK